MFSSMNDIEYLFYLRKRIVYEHAAQIAAPGNTVLDLGCGTGLGTALLAEHAEQVVGLDVDEARLTFAVDRCRDLNCELALYNGQRIPHQDNTFQVITCVHVIEHIRDPAASVREIARVLAPGGTFVCATPNRATRLPSGARPFNRDHHTEYDADGFRDLLRECFEEVEVLAVYGSPEIRRIEKKRVRTLRGIARWDLFGIDRIFPDHALHKALFTMWDRMPWNRNFCGTKQRFDTDDFHMRADGLEEGLDFCAVCRGKGRRL